MKLKKTADLIFISIATILGTWVIFGALPYFRLNGKFPQVDTQIIFLHGLCSILFFYQAIKIIINKNEIKVFNHALIIIPFLLALLGVLTSLLSNNPNTSFYGSMQIGQGVFWYFDVVIMSALFSQIMHIKKVRCLLFLNLFLVTIFITFFTFYPGWKGLPISFYFFTDYLCFYGVLTFIMFTTLTKNIYLNIFCYIVLGAYLSLLDNRAAIIVWITTLLILLTYFILKYVNNFIEIKKFRVFLFSNGMFVFIIFLFSCLTLLSSLYFWPGDYMLPLAVKDTVLDSLVVRGKLIETVLMGLDSFKNLLFGFGWGIIPDILLEHMNVWQFSELRLGSNLHFHSHNELAEHIVSLGLLGGVLFLLYIFFIFKNAEYFSFFSKLGWLVFFKINCFWFLWTGTLPLFVVVVSCFISLNNLQKPILIFLKPDKINQYFTVSLSIVIGFFLIYGAIITYDSTKVFASITYGEINKSIKVNNKKPDSCLESYRDFKRGGMLLEKYMNVYSAYLLKLSEEEIPDDALLVLQELQCKANKIIAMENPSNIFLSTAMLVDARYYFGLGGTSKGEYYFKNFYDGWYMKALLMAERMPKRGDLLFPFLSYAINNNKTDDAAKVCERKVKGIQGFCNIIFANQLLSNKPLDENVINQSLQLIRKGIEEGVFNELIPIYYWKKDPNDERFLFPGVMGIPLSPNILFIISDKEKTELENIIND
ncbi:hypothetical protein N9R86_00585 [Alphaproteobacteria bacterium]|nr:hypothetical protein [Alphaproteobacteria bacterium]